jgi:hypothetical protein
MSKLRSTRPFARWKSSAICGVVQEKRRVELRPVQFTWRTSVSSTSVTVTMPGAGCSITSTGTVSTAGDAFVTYVSSGMFPFAVWAAQGGANLWGANAPTMISCALPFWAMT